MSVLNVIAQNKLSATTIASSHARERAHCAAGSIPANAISGTAVATAKAAADSQKAEELAEDIMGARQVERERNVESPVLELSAHTGNRVQCCHEHGGEPDARGIKGRLKARALRDGDLTNEKTSRKGHADDGEREDREARYAALRASYSARSSLSFLHRALHDDPDAAV